MRGRGGLPTEVTEENLKKGGKGVTTEVIKVDLNAPMAEIRATLSKYPAPGPDGSPLC